MHSRNAPHVATGAGRAGVGHSGEGDAVTGGIGAACGAVVADILSMQRIGEMSPLERMNRLFIAQMALDAGDSGDAAAEIIAVAVRTPQGMVLCRILMTRRQPAGGMFSGLGVKIGL